MQEKQFKTFWTVENNVRWEASPTLAWFDDRDKAVAFSKQDYTDKPVARVARTKKTIEQYNENVARSQYWEDI